MSTLVPSLSERPFVISGIESVFPPDPVEADTPAPVLMNHSSSVNCVAPSGEGVPAVPRRIPSFTPSRSNAWFPAADEIGASGSDDATMASVAKATSEIRRHARLDVRVIDASLRCFTGVGTGGRWADRIIPPPGPRGHGRN